MLTQAGDEIEMNHSVGEVDWNDIPNIAVIGF